MNQQKKQEQISSAIKERLTQVPFINFNLRIWMYFSILFPNRKRNWRKFLLFLHTLLLNVMQLFYLNQNFGDLSMIVLNLFFMAGIVNSLVRTMVVILKHSKLEKNLQEMSQIYWEIMVFYDDDSSSILEKEANRAYRIAVFNCVVGFLNVGNLLVYPLFCASRIHPFGIALPHIDMTVTPLYEIFYLLEIPIPFLVICLMYMPFWNLFISFALFTKALLQILKYKLSNIYLFDTEKDRYDVLIECIRFHTKIARFVRNFNQIVAYILGLEAILVSCMICLVLYSIIVTDSIIEELSFTMFIITTFYIQFVLYDFANNLVIESNEVSQALCDVPWYECSIKFRIALYIFLMQSQRSLVIKVSNVYPMTLAMFKSLLSLSYTYFTTLRSISRK